MSEPEEQTKGFKVTDRRSFTREGERIQSTEEDREASEPKTAASAAPASSTASTRVDDAKRDAETRYRAVRGQNLHFMDLLSLLATQASFALGAPHPATGEAQEDLESARLLISMLEVLKDKTKGNLAHDEESALDEILYQLRMEFMLKAKVIKS